MNRPEFDAHLLSWEGDPYAEYLSSRGAGEGRALGLEHCGNYPSGYEAIRTIAERMLLKTVRVWVRKAEAAGGTPTAPTSEVEAELRALRPEEPRAQKTIEILKVATTFFARECDPPRK